MPFGKYGPANYPPRGVPVFDLPAEYLAWFAKKGFPKGRLGELLLMIFEIKECGADEVFKPLRTHNGGRFRLSRKSSQGWRLILFFSKGFIACGSSNKESRAPK